MRHIEKSIEPKEFTDWKATHPDVVYSDLGRDKLYPGAQKARFALRDSLLAEQKGLCCYCETRIDNGDFHVEHFRPKDTHLFPELQLDYGNLHACCRKNPHGGDDEYCGHRKKNDFSDSLVSPLESDCSTHFIFDITGKVTGTDDRGKATVSILNLNSVLLTKSRKNLIEEFEDMDDETFDSEIKRHLDSETYPLGEYYTAIEYLYTAGLLH